MGDVILARIYPAMWPIARRLITPLVYGVGVNDSSHPIVVGGKHIRTYSLWESMLSRCYSAKYLKKHHTYKGCSVCPTWLRFSVFESWVLDQPHEGLCLDKDLLCPGNKVYGPNTCVFVTQYINNLLLDHAAGRGSSPLGVTFDKSRGKFAASVMFEGGRIFLGRFATPQLAHAAWQVEKASIIESAAAEVNDIRVQAALLARANKLKADLAAGIETISTNHMT